ncbi:MAG: multiprotein-bridging factor 1 family protein [Thermomicrobiales bacterium]
MGNQASKTDIVLSAEQVRAARALMGWSRKDLATVSGLSQGTIKAIERGRTDYRLSTLRKLTRTFQAHGVSFLRENGWSGIVIKTAALDQLTRVV